jgi:hypothetical protein
MNPLTVKPLLLLPVNFDPESEVLIIFCGEASLDVVLRSSEIMYYY